MSWQGRTWRGDTGQVVCVWGLVEGHRGTFCPYLFLSRLGPFQESSSQENLPSSRELSFSRWHGKLDPNNQEVSRQLCGRPQTTYCMSSWIQDSVGLNKQGIPYVGSGYEFSIVNGGGVVVQWSNNNEVIITMVPTIAIGYEAPLGTKHNWQRSWNTLQCTEGVTSSHFKQFHPHTHGQNDCHTSFMV